MKNTINVNKWLFFYKNFVSNIWKNSEYSNEEQMSFINKLLDTTTDNETSVDVYNAKSDLRVRLFLLDLVKSNNIKCK